MCIRPFVYTFLVMFSCVCCVSEARAVEPDEKIIKGAWKVVYVEEDGTATPDETLRSKTIIYVFEDEVFEIHVDGKSMAKAAFKLEPSTKPKHIDFRREGEAAAKGLYQLTEDTLVLCVPVAAGNAERPKDLTAARGSGVVLMKFERVKK